MSVSSTVSQGLKDGGTTYPVLKSIQKESDCDSDMVALFISKNNGMVVHTGKSTQYTLGFWDDDWAEDSHFSEVPPGTEVILRAEL